MMMLCIAFDLRNGFEPGAAFGECGIAPVFWKDELPADAKPSTLPMVA